jgi:hypothetical protein
VIDDFPMREWMILAVKPSVVKRSLKYALIVGLILILINHSDAILNRDVTFSRFLRMLLTVLVPYTVSTLSSVGTLLEQSRAAGRSNQKSEIAT